MALAEKQSHQAAPAPRDALCEPKHIDHQSIVTSREQGSLIELLRTWFSLFDCHVRRKQGSQFAVNSCFNFTEPQNSQMA